TARAGDLARAAGLVSLRRDPDLRDLWQPLVQCFSSVHHEGPRDGLSDRSPTDARPGRPVPLHTQPDVRRQPRDDLLARAHRPIALGPGLFRLARDRHAPLHHSSRGARAREAIRCRVHGLQTCRSAMAAGAAARGQATRAARRARRTGGMNATARVDSLRRRRRDAPLLDVVEGLMQARLDAATTVADAVADSIGNLARRGGPGDPGTVVDWIHDTARQRLDATGL